MTDATLEEQQPEEGVRQASGGGRSAKLLFGALLLLLPVAPSTFAVVAVYMAPTWVAACFRIFHMPGALMTVAGLNLAGTMPALYFLWTHGNDFDLAFSLLFNWEFLVLDLAAAAMGVALLWIAPFIARTWVDVAGQHLLTKAEAEKKRLIDEWGEGLLPEPEEPEDETD